MRLDERHRTGHVRQAVDGRRGRDRYRERFLARNVRKKQILATFTLGATYFWTPPARPRGRTMSMYVCLSPLFLWTLRRDEDHYEDEPRPPVPGAESGEPQRACPCALVTWIACRSAVVFAHAAAPRLSTDCRLSPGPLRR